MSKIIRSYREYSGRKIIQKLPGRSTSFYTETHCLSVCRKVNKEMHSNEPMRITADFISIRFIKNLNVTKKKCHNYEMRQAKISRNNRGSTLLLTPLCKMSAHLCLPKPRLHLTFSKWLSVV